MPETEWMDLVKCGFGMYESLCSSCSVNYHDYCVLAVSSNCCSQSPGNSPQGLIVQTARAWIRNDLLCLPNTGYTDGLTISLKKIVMAAIRNSTKTITLAPSLSRDIWSAFGGYGPVWDKVRPSVGSPTSGAMCWLHQGERVGWRGSLPDAGTGQLGQRAAGVFWLRWQASVWQVATRMPRQPGNDIIMDPVTLCFLCPFAVIQMSTPWHRC